METLESCWLQESYYRRGRCLSKLFGFMGNQQHRKTGKREATTSHFHMLELVHWDMVNTHAQTETI